MNQHPNEDLYRGDARAPQYDSARTDADQQASDAVVMQGHFTRFDEWYPIDSWFEGRFLERVAKGAAKKTIRENRDQIKVQFDHGYDFNIGDALLGPIDELREDDEGVFYSVPLLDTDYNRDRIVPMLDTILIGGERRGGSLLGASFRFSVKRDEWNKEPKKSDYNPDGIPERTIREFRLFEFGPVVWPASPTATAGLRSLTDHFHARRLARNGQAARAAEQLLAQLPAGTTTGSDDESTTPPARHLVAPQTQRLAAALQSLKRKAS